MKIFICKRCIPYGGKEPCILTCEDDTEPIYCPCDDNALPNAHWEPHNQQINSDRAGKCPDCGGDTQLYCPDCDNIY